MDQFNTRANPSSSDRPGEGPGVIPGPAAPEFSDRARISAVVAAARYHGLELNPADFRRPQNEKPGDPISPAALVAWLRDEGMVAKGMRLRWRQLVTLHSPSPVVLLLSDGSAGLLVGSDEKRGLLWVRDPLANPAEDPVAVDELRLSQVWDGDAIFIRKTRDKGETEQPFSLGWVGNLVLQQKKLMRDIFFASLTLSVMAILPAMLVMTIIDRVVSHRSLSTLALIAAILIISMLFEMLLGWARREITSVLGARIDAQINLHIFARLLALPLDFFERTQAGQTTYRVMQIYKVRDFMTGKLLNVALDGMTLVILLPFLFWLDATLAWMVCVAASLMSVVIYFFMGPISRVMNQLVQAESEKGSVLVETVHGVRTVKTLALEPARKVDWDFKVARASDLRIKVARVANWPQTLIAPLQWFIDRGVLLFGAYLVVTNGSDLGVGALVAFMMLGGRVTSPLVGLARLMDDLADVQSSVSEVGSVLNNPTETAAMQGGLRPKFAGAISFDGVSFTYPLGKTPALDGVSFSVPAGTMLGVVGRSGSGKSTLTRLLQGVNRDYNGYLKIDGADLREINLVHLRRSLGVVLQDNFLFRGSVRDNITAGRPGLTLEDAVRAARLAGAEEFIERLPQGYETWIEEGSANLSGGQRQRLAIARALITDPRIMILDEATSALDPESEALVNANLTRISKGRTMVIVSHRLSSLVDCDQILVMEKGKVADIAPHYVLVERCATYKQLWAQQNRHLNSEGGRQPSVVPVLAQGDD